jgi:hypothetical protein
MPLSVTELEHLKEMLEEAVEHDQIIFWPGPDVKRAHTIDMVWVPSPYIDVDLS